MPDYQRVARAVRVSASVTSTYTGDLPDAIQGAFLRGNPVVIPITLRATAPTAGRVLTAASPALMLRAPVVGLGGLGYACNTGLAAATMLAGIGA